MSVDNLNELGFLRVAAATPRVRVADVDYNVAQICTLATQAAEQGCELVVFPELSITAYSCGDLFYQTRLQQAALSAVQQLAAELPVACVVGLPLAIEGRLFNVMALLSGGRILGFVPKTHLPNHHEFYEQRWFSSGRLLPLDHCLLDGARIPLGTDLLFPVSNRPGCCIGLEVCEDLWAVEPPSGQLALQGATLLLNASASNELLGKAAYRRQLVKQQSARCLAAYVYASAGVGESSTDLCYGGHALIAENGQTLAENARFSQRGQLLCADIDFNALENERLTCSTFGDQPLVSRYRRVAFSFTSRPLTTPPLLRPLSRQPFVPEDTAQRDAHCEEIFAILSTALAKRLAHTNCRTAVLGVSGGLDSTLALLVVVEAFKRLDWPLSAILAVTMPGFGSTHRTQNNAAKLAELLTTGYQEIPIHAAVNQHFADIGHDPKVHDITYENAQARERTQILMDMANRHQGLVVGTGDLSELALGWCTYNADQMAMYNVNAGVPKTLVRYLVNWAADSLHSSAVGVVLHDIGNTPVSPELLPCDPNDESGRQNTEAEVGPYELHDFFLYYVLRRHFRPQKILFLATQVFADDYAKDTIRHWLRLFVRRFFQNQFKRSAMPDGPKVGSVALSPRGDWRMPSDAVSQLWLQDLEDLKHG